MPLGASLFAQPLVNNKFPACIFSERFVLRRRYVPAIGPLKTVLIFTDGVCLDNNGPNATRRRPRTGWSFIFKKNPEEGVVSGVLELKGLDGRVHRPTNERAELRGALAALEYRIWASEGWEQVVIATDSLNLVEGATALLRDWAAKDWRTARGLVQNRDLWERLSQVMGECADGGCEVKFWHIAKGWNTEAHQAAREAVEDGKFEENYIRRMGFFTREPASLWKYCCLVSRGGYLSNQKFWRHCCHDKLTFASANRTNFLMNCDALIQPIIKGIS